MCGFVRFKATVLLAKIILVTVDLPAYFVRALLPNEQARFTF